jgi:uncharacterized protein
MRTPADLPRRERLAPRGRAALIVLAVVVFVLVTSLRGIAGFWTDYLWFDSLGLTTVWSGILGARIALGVIFTALFFVLLWSNLFIADRLAPRFRPAGPEEEVVERYHELVGERTGLVRAGVALTFAVIAGLPVAGQWNEWILFTNSQTFGASDPQFGRDVGFFVFQLPFLTFLVDWAFAALVIVLIVTAVAHYLNGGIRVQTPAQRVTPQVKAHLSVLLAVLALVRAAGYYLQRFELTYSDRGVVRGAGFTDVNAQLPALNLLILISLAAVVLLLVNIRRRGWVLPILAVGLWAFVAVVAGGIYPAFVQRFQVEPAESSREAEFIRYNIEATRAAMGLDNVEVDAFDYNESLDADDLQDNEGTIRNVRLLDPGVVDDTYQRLQGLTTFYEFPDLDVDRYEIDGEITQVVISARELARDRVPQDSWEARQLAYTHGFGIALSPANAVTGTGRPLFIVGSLPQPEDTPEVLQMEQPAIYFGERIGGYSIVNTERDEVQPVGTEGTGRYEGIGGVEVGGFFRRAAFFLRFADPNLVISNLIGNESQILYIRDVRDRVETLAPFLHFDNDPYTVLLDGRIVYVIDGYTTSNRYPYGQPGNTADLPGGSGLNHEFSYVRNSVKAVVGAYDGDVTFYVMDPEDPVINAYRDAFPRLFTDLEDMPEDLRQHLRYPEDLFRVQTMLWGRYHLDEPEEFYEQRAAWSVAQDPGASIVPDTPGATADPQTGQLTPRRRARIEPYYQLMRMPNDDDESFVILRPFVPFSENDNRNELSAFMVAHSDFDDYGRLRVYTMPAGNLPDGPAIVASNIASNEEIAQRVSLLDQRGSEVRLGNLLLIPVNQSLLYIRPLYTQAAADTAVPELRNVIVAFGGQVVMRPTLRQALEELFGSAPETQEAEPERDDDLPGDETPAPEAGDDDDVEVGDDVGELLQRASAAFAEAEQALRDGDLALYQRRVREAQRLVERALDQDEGGGGGTDAGPTTTTTTTEPPGDATA